MAKRIVPSKEFKEAITRVIDYLVKNPKGARLDGGLRIDYGFKYIKVWWSWTVLILLPNGEAFEPGKDAGRLPGYRVGNIIDLVSKPNWQNNVCFRLSEFNQPLAIVFAQSPESLKCEICDRTQHVQRTVVGLRCSHCRGADVRHMNIVRQLGGIPTAGRQVLRTNEDYYRIKK